MCQVVCKFQGRERKRKLKPRDNPGRKKKKRVALFAQKTHTQKLTSLDVATKMEATSGSWPFFFFLRLCVVSVNALTNCIWEASLASMGGDLGGQMILQ